MRGAVLSEINSDRHPTMINIFQFDRPIPLQDFFDDRRNMPSCVGREAVITIITPTLQRIALLPQVTFDLSGQSYQHAS